MPASATTSGKPRMRTIRTSESSSRTRSSERDTLRTTVWPPIVTGAAIVRHRSPFATIVSYRYELLVAASAIGGNGVAAPER